MLSRLPQAHGAGPALRLHLTLLQSEVLLLLSAVSFIPQNILDQPLTFDA